MRKFLFSLTCLACVNATPTALQPVTAPRGTEKLWDSYGVPHIFAKDRGGLAYAFGWAQMQNHRDLNALPSCASGTRLQQRQQTIHSE